jgi:hypothetical protein
MGARICARCGRTATAGQNFCANCGAALAPPDPQPGMRSDAAEPSGDEESVAEGYQSGMTLGAVLLTIFAPFIALIVALVMRGSETNPAKRAFLKTWAWASGAVLACGTLIVLAFAATVLSSGPHVDSSGPCIGGPIMGVPAQPLGGNKYRVQCVDGGSDIVTLP